MLCSRYQVVFWKQDCILDLMWVGNKFIIGVQVWKNFFTLDSFRRLASTQSMRSKKVNFSRNIRCVGRIGPIHSWRMALRAAAEMQNSRRCVWEGRDVSVSCRLPKTAQLGVRENWCFVWVTAKRCMRPQKSPIRGHPQKQWNKSASASPHLEQADVDTPPIR